MYERSDSTWLFILSSEEKKEKKVIQTLHQTQNVIYGKILHEVGKA
jgi:hypothetical protein